MAIVGAQILVRWPCALEEFFIKLNQYDIYVAGPESHFVITDVKEESIIRASEKRKRTLELICIGREE